MSSTQTSDAGLYPIGYCALEYRARDYESVPPKLENVIFIVQRLGRNELSFKVRPGWEEIVDAEDRSIVKELLDDFMKRAKLDSESLLRQIAALNVGQLVTYDAGERLSAHPDLLELFNSFK